MRMAEMHSSSIVNGNLQFTDGSIESLKEVYANVSAEHDDRCILSVYEKQTGMLRPFQTYSLKNDTYGLDSGVIQKVSHKRFGKDTVKEFHYVSLVLKDKTVTLVFHTIEERRKWKGYIAQYLELDKEPKRLRLISERYGTESVTVHVNDKRIVVISERKELRPAQLKFAWEIQDIVVHSIDACHLILINNQNVTKRLEYLKGRSELQEIDDFIRTRKKRLRLRRPEGADTRHEGHHTAPVVSMAERQRTRDLPERSPTEVMKKVPRQDMPLPPVPSLPTRGANRGFPDAQSKSGTSLQSRGGRSSGSRQDTRDHSDTNLEQGPDDHLQDWLTEMIQKQPRTASPKSKREMKRPDPLPMPPPPPCPGVLMKERVEQDPLIIYGYPKINRYFNSSLPARRETLNLNEVAEILSENLLDIENFHKKRASLFEKFSECHRQSCALNPALDIAEVDEITGVLEKIEVDTKETETQTSFSNVQLNTDEAQIYMVGYVIHKVIRQPPERETLELPERLKKEICMGLYATDFEGARHDWRALASEIGMTNKAVNMISSFLQNQATPGYVTCAEVVLRHWQYTYNTYSTGHKHHPKYPCTHMGLRAVLKAIGRMDLCRLLD